MDQSVDEIGAGALHAGNDGAPVISSGLIKVGRDADVLLWRSGVQDKRHESKNGFVPTLRVFENDCNN